MNNKKTKKGFTLTELIIVIAIIGVLSAILIPAWNYFIRRARDRDAASKAKVVFNAAQTELTKLRMNERIYVNRSTDPKIGSVKNDEAKKQIYVGEGDFYFYWNGNTGFKLDPADGITEKDTAANAANNASLAKGINNIVGGSGAYKIYVKNYDVQAVMYADMNDSRYKGTYPVSVITLDDSGVDIGPIRHTTVKDANLSTFMLGSP